MLHLEITCRTQLKMKNRKLHQYVKRVYEQRGRELELRNNAKSKLTALVLCSVLMLPIFRYYEMHDDVIRTTPVINEPYQLKIRED